MNQKQPSPHRQQPSRVYTEEEQRLRWALIIEAILRDLTLSLAQEQQPVTSLPRQELKQTT